jgi:HEPN domain-containing protein
MEMSHEDLRTARKLLAYPEVPPRQSCYLAQQSAEKMLKAALIQMQIEFPYTHDLDALTERLPEHSSVRQQFSDLSGLSRFVVSGRYPGNWDPPTTDDALAAVDLASRLIGAVEIELQRPGWE